MYKIAISDLDGTLLGPDHRLSEQTKKSISKWIQDGRKFVIATGRHYIEAKHLQKDINEPIYLISSNGARVHDKQGNIIHAQNLDANIVAEICQTQFDKNVQVNLFTDKTWFANFIVPELMDIDLGAGFYCQQTDLTSIDSTKAIKMFFWAEPELLQPIYERLNKKYGKRINLTFSLTKCLEMMDANTNKGTAVQAVLKEKGLSSEDAIAFGDAMNDVEMLRLVGKGVLMANSQKLLCEALPNAEKIGSSKEHGVAMMLNKLLED
ncbi:hydrolase [Psychromonas sp. PRT-SC03]|nr:hydrolase [Psychromonas sp. PRT-SC03]